MINIESLKIDGKIDGAKLEELITSKPIRPIIEEGEDASVYSVKVNRDRFTDFPNRLPTYDTMPLPIDEHKFIGEFESKQNIYLTFAHAFNKAMEEIELLKRQVADLQTKLDNTKEVI